jgi:hypothetical protein
LAPLRALPHFAEFALLSIFCDFDPFFGFAMIAPVLVAARPPH